MSRELPAKPNLEHLKKQAKKLLYDFQEGEPGAIERLDSLAPSATASPKLAEAQHVISREYGFASWLELKEHVDSLARAQARGAALCVGLL